VGANAGAQAGPAGPKQKLTVGYVANDPAQFPAWVAKERGFFDQNGLDVTFAALPGGSDPTKTLIAGQVQALEISVEALEADEDGADLIYVAGPIDNLLFSLYAQSGLTSPASLKGKRIGYTEAGSASSAAVKAALGTVGLDATRDVTLVPLQRMPAVLAELRGGAIDAGMLRLNWAQQARAAGMTELVDVGKSHTSYPLAWDAVSKKYRDQQRGAVAAYVKSIVQAMAFASQQPVPTQLIMGKYSQQPGGGQSAQPAASGAGPGDGSGRGPGDGSGRGPGNGSGQGAGAAAKPGGGAAGGLTLMKSLYDAMSPYFERNPVPDVTAVDNALREMATDNPKARQLRAADLVDPSFVNDLQAGGFIGGLYK